MPSTTPTRGPRTGTTAGPEAALTLLDYFCNRILPGVLRRVACWKGLRLRHHPDLIADLRQELAVDCLEHSAEVCRLSDHERHRRWFRLLERTLYRMHLRDDRVADRDAPLELLPVARPPVVTAEETEPLLDDEGQDLLNGLLESRDELNNGRRNLSASAARLGVQSRRVRRLWEDVAEQLGYGADFVTFWQRRLAEAALGLAADLMRDSGALQIHGESARVRPDPEGRQRRIRRIQAAVRIRPMPRDFARWLRTILRCRRRGMAAVGRLLDCAEALAPGLPGAHLWRFEACILTGELGGAAQAVRSARLCDADPVAVALARARLLEARGRDRRALGLLSRALQRYRGDGRLLAALRRGEGALPARP